jgi:hypothetical protein
MMGPSVLAAEANYSAVILVSIICLNSGTFANAAEDTPLHARSRWI